MWCKRVLMILALMLWLPASAGGIGRALLGQKPAPKQQTGEVPTPPNEAPIPAAVAPAQQPIERSPGFSESPFVLGVDAKGNFGITSIDRNHPTVKAWIDEKVISEDQIRRIQGGEAVDIPLPDAH